MGAALEPLPAPLAAGVRGVFTTRAGGASTGPWSALNLAQHVGDDPDAVAANRAAIARDFGVGRVCFVSQVHGTDVRTIAASDSHEAPSELGYDALVTNTPGVAVGVLVADCLPVLMADPHARVVAAAHTGRRGLAAGILQRTLERLVDLGADPAETVAVIGPGIGGCCYEVPSVMRAEVAAALPAAAASTTWGTPSLDLPAGAAEILTGAGVGRVERLDLCTAEDRRFYSYRREGQTGRFAGIVMLLP